MAKTVPNIEKSKKCGILPHWRWLWSAAACCRFILRRLLRAFRRKECRARRRGATAQALRCGKWQQAAALQKWKKCGILPHWRTWVRGHPFASLRAGFPAFRWRLPVEGKDGAPASLPIVNRQTLSEHVTPMQYSFQ